MKQKWPGELILETERLAVIVPGMELANRLLSYHERNREFVRHAVPTPAPESSTVKFWRERIKLFRQGYRLGVSYNFYLLPKDDPGGEILGNMTFNHVSRGPLMAAILGYKLDLGAEGKGLMREALEGGLSLMFDSIGLHRVEANVRPDNPRSYRLLRRLGFVVEGFSGDYLKLDGEWRDHLRLAKINPSEDRGRTKSLDLRSLGITMPDEP